MTDEKFLWPIKEISLEEARELYPDKSCSGCAQLRAKLESIKTLVDKQAEDPGLWCPAERIAEAHLQQELRKLHEIIEGVSQEECAFRAIERMKDAP